MKLSLHAPAPQAGEHAAQPFLPGSDRTGMRIAVPVVVPSTGKPAGFVEGDGPVALEARHYPAPWPRPASDDWPCRTLAARFPA
ncbi:hypothetical protein CSC71_04655 [Pseudoxanthomonas sangjuensis]|uniref:hypothetical protein n=1 Tax=Pseudoxanthomonas sangjuensis TaxID=1503750 RepID=UPI001391EC86|nr:hypothetical protein [Pseudoxanthomonas sangjuensis]KAF1714324.1 hypothetical protein CSC71_04655 [Pseudoxanthomonas sangjuensis]